MKERIHQYGQQLLGKAIVETMMPTMRKAYAERGCVGMAERAFDILHARPEYLHESDPDFELDRKKLNSEPGLIISNHPGPGDCPVVLQTLTRRDLKFLVAEEAIKGEKLDTVVPKEMLLGAAKDVGKLRPIFKTIISHIQSGGALFYFPTGLAKDQSKAIFASLFRALIQNIPAESMVYAFNIDAADVKKVASKGAFAARSSADFILPNLVKPITKIGEPSVIHVDERYTQASQWLENVKRSGRPKAEFNHVMTEYYENLFE